MAVAVVHPLEAIQIGEQEGGAGVRPFGPLRGVRGSLLQQPPVRQLRQRVVQGAVVELVRSGLKVLAGLGVEHVGEVWDRDGFPRCAGRETGPRLISVCSRSSRNADSFDAAT
ncbi:MAG: hypothetical protein QOJ19_2684 [Acidimicrobiia bacterium]|nr:hypothetical protein [Acidimicrobiia bacterium]